MNSKIVAVFAILIIAMLAVTASGKHIFNVAFTKNPNSVLSESHLETVSAGEVRKGRNFGYPGGFGGSNANANAFASSSSQNIGGGFPGGFGGGFSASNAQAVASSNNFGYGK